MSNRTTPICSVKQTPRDRHCSSSVNAKANRTCFTCLPKNYNVNRVRNQPKTDSSLSIDSQDSLLALYGLKPAPKRVKQCNIPSVSVKEISSNKKQGFKVNRNKLFGFNLGLCLLIFLCGALGAFSYSFFVHYYYPALHCESRDTSIIPSTDRLSEKHSGLVQLKEYMLHISEQLKSLKEQVSKAEITQKSDIILKPSKGVLEELFPEEPDLACTGLLGSVVATPDTVTTTNPSVINVLGLSWTVKVPHRPPQTTIKGLIQGIGDCWSFVGQSGRLVLSLHRPSHLTGVSISHIPHTMSPSGEIVSAPRYFRVLVHEDEQDFDNGLLLGQFEYINQGPWRQAFSFSTMDVKKAFKIVEFHFISNHGSSGHTCVYRVHVHGNMISS